jgi:hypothetical protein
MWVTLTQWVGGGGGGMCPEKVETNFKVSCVLKRYQNWLCLCVPPDCNALQVGVRGYSVHFIYNQPPLKWEKQIRHTCILFIILFVADILGITYFTNCCILYILHFLYFY